MDAFGDLFRDVRAHGSLFGSSALSAPWALDFVDGAPLTLCTVLDGGGWIVPEHGEPEPLNAYDTVVVRGPGNLLLRRRGRHRRRAGLLRRTLRDARRRRDAAPAGAGTTPATARRRLIVGAYPVRGEIGARLLDALPAVLRVEGGGTGDAVLDHLAAEVAVDAPGQQVVLDRLLDWMLVCTLREWFAPNSPKRCQSREWHIEGL